MDQELLQISSEDAELFDNFSGTPEELDDELAAIQKPASFSAVIHCIFSARFDEQEGPIIEWQYPKDFDLEGVEFNVLASGLHNKAGPDIIYFKKDEFYGIACYRRHLQGNKAGRDAVMRSAGIIMDHYGFMYKHTPFLIKIVNEQTTPKLQDSAVELLMSYWKKNQPDTLTILHPPSPSLALNLPNDAFSDLFALLGVNIFVIWKAVMLRKKVLFVMDPPLRALCLHVYAAGFLTRHQVKTLQRKIPDPRLLFYVNITQTRMVLGQKDYIACTTERIFETKSHLYDVLVTATEEGCKIIVNDAELKEALKLTVGDKLKHMYLMKKFQAQDQNMLLSFFQDMNNRVLSSIWQARMRTTPLNASLLPSFGLHTSDFNFFEALVEHLEIDLPFQAPLCCSWCM